MCNLDLVPVDIFLLIVYHLIYLKIYLYTINCFSLSIFILNSCSIASNSNHVQWYTPDNNFFEEK